MTVDIKDGFVTVTADPGKAIRKVGADGPSCTLSVRFAEGYADPHAWEDCELGEDPVPESPTEADKDSALRKFGVDI